MEQQASGKKSRKASERYAKTITGGIKKELLKTKKSCIPKTREATGNSSWQNHPKFKIIGFLNTEHFTNYLVSFKIMYMDL